jgi:hypothetical protein
VGDVFRLMHYGDGRHGYGQILATFGTSGGHFYFGVFPSEYTGGDPALEPIVADDFALIALSMDALLYHGHWSVVGNAAVDQDRVRWLRPKSP